ncbi:Membrane carboxypeptidase (penicillin-binding protein) [Actinopolyspora xinjiangensis]|uniref:Membrane carboxypeptidase (Penicillin-binding protein) n=1 Tax=Actinopolyspora xinjiangensis TaxID=405564 RepID=A0A1H0VQF0_9ACTN|nr:Membrane carboxypeptidase (penicillin-binding protein) [Actinopolyspora xinjiangensis]
MSGANTPPDERTRQHRPTGGPTAGAAGAAAGAAGSGPDPAGTNGNPREGASRDEEPETTRSARSEPPERPSEFEATRAEPEAPLDNDPGLITHRASQGGYSYYSDADPYPDDDHDDFEDRFDDELDYPDDPDDDDMTALARKKRGRRRIWRGLRRTCYVAAALAILVPGAVFAWCYFTFDIIPPSKVAKNYNTSLVVKYSDGSLLNKFSPDEGQERVLIDDLSEVPEDMRHATMAAEDADFYSNPGFSVSGIGRAVYNQLSGGQGGGSTMTQQYIKLSTGRDAHTIKRKFTEIVRAFKLTNQYDKTTIFKAYLNTAYYGRDAYGIDNAAEAYFGKDPSELNASESALLAGMVQLPRGNDPRVDAKRAEKRWEYVTGQMRDNGWLSQREYESLEMPQTRPMFAWKTKTTTAQIHIQQRIVEELEERGYTKDDMTSQGLQVVTTLDKQAQQAAQEAVRQVMADQPEEINPALAAVDPKSGAVRAYYPGNKGYDWVKQRQPVGSSFKPFVTATGLKQGHGIGETYDGSDDQTIGGTEFGNAGGVRCTHPKRCGVREATEESVNTAFVNMANKFGPQSVAETAYEAGIPREKVTDDGETKPVLADARTGNPDLGIALGRFPVSTLSLANGYGGLADGERAEPFLVDKIVDNDGEVKEDFSPETETAFDESSTRSANIAANVTESMRDVAEGYGLDLTGDRPVASKSGTHQFNNTSHNETASYVGYTPQISTAVVLNKSTTSKQPLTDASGSDIYGANEPGEIWQKFMNAYLAGKPVERFQEPDPIGQFSVPPPPSSEEPKEETEESSTPPSSEPESSEPESDSSSTPPSSGWSETSEPNEDCQDNPWFSDCEGNGDGSGDGDGPGDGNGDGNGNDDEVNAQDNEGARRPDSG